MTTKVFIVLGFNDDGEPRVRAVFSTRELAESYCGKGDFQILEGTLDATEWEERPQ